MKYIILLIDGKFSVIFWSNENIDLSSFINIDHIYSAGYFDLLPTQVKLFIVHPTKKVSLHFIDYYPTKHDSRILRTIALDGGLTITDVEKWDN